LYFFINLEQKKDDETLLKKININLNQKKVIFFLIELKIKKKLKNKLK